MAKTYLSEIQLKGFDKYKVSIFKLLQATKHIKFTVKLTIKYSSQSKYNLQGHAVTISN